MNTLTYGQKLPEANDPAATWMGAIEDNITRTDAHSHNGTDSVLLTPAAVTKYSSTVSSGSWSSAGGGMYTQTITVPAAITEFNSSDIYIYITSTGERIFPGIVRASATTYTITVNDNSLALTVKYN